MDINYYKSLEPYFGYWTIVRELGEGGFGKVFEINRQDFGKTYKSALKTITIPTTQSEVKSLIADGMDYNNAFNYYRGFVEEVVGEFALMSELKGHSNIVSYEDHMVRQHENEIGWDIFIRMELLTSLIDYDINHDFTQADCVKLGIDMCKALEYCEAHNIIHRDIKPENIFVSDSGDFKLGDFGIARTVEKTTSGLSRKGTYSYMAPEVYKGNTYGPTVDIYSLGIVLYRMLNNGRTPFLPPYPQVIKHSDKEESVAKRINGTPIPPIPGVDDRINSVVLKACAYNPEQRYAHAREMRKELEKIYISMADDEVVSAPASAPSVDNGTVVLVNRPNETSNSEGFGAQSVRFDPNTGLPINSINNQTVSPIPPIPQNQGIMQNQNIPQNQSIPQGMAQGMAQQFTPNPSVPYSTAPAPKKKNPLLVGLACAGGVVAMIVIMLIAFGAGGSRNDNSTASAPQNYDGMNDTEEKDLSDVVEDTNLDGEAIDSDSPSVDSYEMSEEATTTMASVDYTHNSKNDQLYGMYSLDTSDIGMSPWWDYGYYYDYFYDVLVTTESYGGTRFSDVPYATIGGKTVAVIPVAIRFGENGSNIWGTDYYTKSEVEESGLGVFEMFEALTLAVSGYAEEDVNEDVMYEYYTENYSDGYDVMAIWCIDEAGNTYKFMGYYNVDDDDCLTLDYYFVNEEGDFDVSTGSFWFDITGNNNSSTPSLTLSIDDGISWDFYRTELDDMR